MKRTLRFLGLSAIVLMLMSLSGCEWIGSLFAQDIIVDDPIGWATTAEDGMNEYNYFTYTVTLPAGGTEHSIWGTDIYTADSSIGTAAVHMGLITFASGGTVTIRYLPGQDSYEGTLRNGVTSGDWGSYTGSFEFVTP